MTLSTGTRLGPYEILAPLGVGGMGEVYRARDARLGREVAVKVLSAEIASDASRLKRFEKEARAASALNHPNIITIYDIGSADSIPYIAMELVSGRTLRELIAEGPLPIRRLLGTAIQIAEGLAQAHAAGIVHRDLKPENVMITKDGLVKLLDFGLAKLVHPDLEGGLKADATTVSGTTPGVVMGTVGYMSPEQASGHPVDFRSDQFSLGSILYEMATGRTPFRRATAAQTLAAIIQDEPEPLERVAPNVPASVRWTLERCLAKEPAERYDSTRDLARDLATCRAHLEVGAVLPAPAGVPKARWRLLAAVGAVIVAVLAILAALLARQRSAGHSPRTDSSSGQPPRIVVLPFDNLGSTEDAYFAAGITEEITSRLANVRKLGVISRTTATEYPRKGKTVKQVGADLDVDWVLEGTIRYDRSRRGSGRVRITPQLIRVADDTHVWSERYDRTLDDIFSLQSEVATRTVEAIGINLLPAEKSGLETIPTEDLVAYDHYLKGLAAETRSFGRNDIEEAIGHFQAAVNRDPSFVLALARLSRMHLQMYWFFYDRSQDRLEKARLSAESAARLGPDLPETHDALGYLYYQGFRDYPRATEEFEAARRIRPSDALATAGLAYVVRRVGRFQESAVLLAEASKLDPRDATLLADFAISLMFSRRYREADDVLATAISLSPGEVLSRAWRIWLQVQWRGDLARAKTLLAEAERIPGLQDDLSWLGLYAYRLSLADRDFAGALRRLDADSRKAYWSQLYFFPVDLLRSQVYGLTGRTDECRRAAEKTRIFLEGEIGKKPGDARLHSALGIALALLGRSDEALRAARRGVELMPTSKDAWIGLWRIEDLAFVCALLGRQDEAIEQLGVLLSTSGEMTPHVLRLDPRWDPLRKNPNFQALLARYEVRP